MTQTPEKERSDMPKLLRPLLDRIGARADAITAAADTEAAQAGLTVTAVTRHRRSYSDPRTADLRAARAAGCFCVPVHLDLAACPRTATRVRKEVA